MKRVVRSISLSAELDRIIVEKCKKYGLTRSELIRQFIIKALKEEK